MLNLILCSTSFSQELKSDSLKCFTIPEAKILLSFARRGQYCDTLTIAYEKKIQTLEEITIQKDKTLLLSNGLINSQRNEIKKLRRNSNILKLTSTVFGSFMIFFIFF